MSFAGHVYDMIRRNKEDREALRRFRDHSRYIREKCRNGKFSLPDTSVEEFEEIERRIKERDLNDKRYFFRAKLIILCLTAGALLLIWWIVTL